MELQIDLLKTFLAIIDTGGFTNASQVRASYPVGNQYAGQAP